MNQFQICFKGFLCNTSEKSTSWSLVYFSFRYSDTNSQPLGKDDKIKPVLEQNCNLNYFKEVVEVQGTSVIL